MDDNSGNRVKTKKRRMKRRIKMDDNRDKMHHVKVWLSDVQFRNLKEKGLNLKKYFDNIIQADPLVKSCAEKMESEDE